MMEDYGIIIIKKINHVKDSVVKKVLTIFLNTQPSDRPGHA